MNDQPLSFNSVPYNFGALPAELSGYENCNVVILPVPYDSTTSYLAGTRHGPRAIIEASQNMELYDEDLRIDFSQFGICTLNQVDVLRGDPEQTMKQIEDIARRIISDNKFLLTLGGEHSITTPLVRACANTYDNLSVLQIDAHLDLRSRYLGSSFSHASVMKRVMEICPRVAVGIRSFSEEEGDYMSTIHDKPFFMSRIRSTPNWIDLVCDELSPNVYITIDLDGFDPSVFPGVGTPEPGGLEWYDGLELLRAVAKNRKIVAADIVELHPLPGQIVSEYAAARLAYKLLASVLQNRDDK